MSIIWLALISESAQNDDFNEVIIAYFSHKTFAS